MAVHSDFVKFEIVTAGGSPAVEKSISKNSSIRDLKMKLELLTGKSFDNMRIALLSDGSHVHDNIAADDSRLLHSFLPQVWDKLTLRVAGTDMSMAEEAADVVPKFELSDEAYEQRGDSLRKFKMQQGLGRFDPEKAAADQQRQQELQQEEQDVRQRLKIGSRCEVRVDGIPVRRGTVMFVGQTEFKPGFVWVGVKYDEPVGKNDGSVSGRQYFQCQANYGGFVKADHVVAGDFPELDPFAEDGDMQ
jgi:tubulin-folding cofactor B